MQYLSQEDIKQISGGVNAQLNLTVNTANPVVAAAFGGLIGNIVESATDAGGIGNYIATNSAAFNLIPINSMVIGGFTITPTP